MPTAGNDTRVDHVAREFDVAIVGGGIGGSVLATILARHNVDVLQIEGSAHPRFAIGESTIPETTFGFRNLAYRYDVPELLHLSNHTNATNFLATSCGIKRSFTFVHHRQGEQSDPRHCNQFLTLGSPLGPDLHYYRQDVDSYLFSTAISYGATCLTNTIVDDVLFDDEGVDLVTRHRGVYRARYVVDAGGMKALLPQVLGLRHDEPPYRTRSRTIFTHMVNVPSWDEVGPDRKEHGLISPPGQSTLHHIFEGGWFWVIPFNNHPSSTNPLCSVGLSLDLDRYPKPADMSPEEEFWHHVDRFPSVHAQLKGSRPVRPFLGNDRNQFASKNVVGDRWCLLPHASDFIDPLFSGGLAATVSVLHCLGHRLIAATRENDYSTARFQYVEEWTKNIFTYYDKLVSTSYASFDSFDLWNAFHRVWTLATAYGTNAILEAAVSYDKSQMPSAFEMLETKPYRGVQGMDFAPLSTLFENAVDVVGEYRNGRLTEPEAIEKIYELLESSGLAPDSWGILDPENHAPAGSVAPLPMLRLLVWGRRRAPASVRDSYFTGGVSLLSKEIAQYLVNNLSPAAKRSSGTVRDLLVPWNSDKKRPIQMISKLPREGLERRPVTRAAPLTGKGSGPFAKTETDQLASTSSREETAK